MRSSAEVLDFGFSDPVGYYLKLNTHITTQVADILICGGLPVRSWTAENHMCGKEKNLGFTSRNLGFTSS